jgi:hypothetical protein
VVALALRRIPPSLFGTVAIATSLYLGISKVSKAVSITQPATPLQLNLSWQSTIAQEPTPGVQVIRQGNQVVVNGKPISLLWSQRQQSIGIVDSGLMQSFGVTLLDSRDVSQQPVQWFSQPTVAPLNLSTWFTSQYRYLDITELMQQAGWQVQVDGSILRISTPASRVLGVRQGRQTWGDRIVVDLDQPALWQVTEQEREILVTLDAQVDPAIAQAFISSSGNRITSLQMESSHGQTVLRIGIPSGLRPKVWTLPDPNRLVIDIRSDSMVPQDILWAPGIRWKQQYVALGSAQFPVFSLEVDPRQSGVSLKPIISNPSSDIGIAPLATTAQLWQAAAAVNGGFFNRNTQMPLGAIRQDGRWVSGPILGRGAIAWNHSGEILINRLSLQDTITTSTGQRFPILFLNSGYVGTGISLHSPDWGSTYTSITDNEMLVTVRNHQVVSQQTTITAGQVSVPIPRDGYLLVLRSYNEAARAMPPGTTLQRETSTLPVDFGRFSQIMGGGPLLLKNRQIVLSAQAESFSDAFDRQAAPRSVIGMNAEGKLIIAAIHNRPDGAGPTLQETAQLLQRMEIIDAVNLDGGSSTSLYLSGQLLNRSPRTAARVHNGIGIFLQPTF